MATTLRNLRTERHLTIGAVIEQNIQTIVSQWVERSKQEQPTAKRVHHETLIDHLPHFLVRLGQSLAVAGDESDGTRQLAEKHGDQRWDSGWSVTELVRDYQILRLVVAEYLEKKLDRRLESREALVLNVAIDDAIAVSVAAFVACQENPGIASNTTRNEALDLLLNVLGTVGHELRNPLGPLNNSLEILRLAGSDLAIIENTRMIMERQLRVLGRLVEDLMDLPRLARGKMSLQLKKLDLAHLVRACAEDRRKGLTSAGLSFAVEVPDGPIEVVGDETRLAQAIGNLIGNSQKFTDSGGAVTVQLTVKENKLVEILVRDTGIGIETNMLPKVFEAYTQADRSLDRSRGGMGLGLALVKGVVELHGGKVSVSSAGLGKGSTFTVELPLIPPMESTACNVSSNQPSTTKPKKILIVEDNADSAESLRLYLELHGHSVRIALSGPDGLKEAHAMPPDVVICDVAMPGMDGYAVAEQLRQIMDPPQLIIAITGHGARTDSEGIPDKRFDYYLLKPANLDHLDRILSAETHMPKDESKSDQT